jgi:hypothetical protein
MRWSERTDSCEYRTSSAMWESIGDTTSLFRRIESDRLKMNCTTIERRLTTETGVCWDGALFRGEAGLQTAMF